MLVKKFYLRYIMADIRSLFDEKVLNDNVSCVLNGKEISLLEAPWVINAREVELELARNISFTLGV